MVMAREIDVSAAGVVIEKEVEVGNPIWKRMEMT
jgi:hypothetical protein